MITVSAATRVFIATGVTDMRKSFNALYGLVGAVLEQDPLSGHLFIFCNRRRDRIKVLCWDGSGLWVCAKRLEKGTFHWPAPAGAAAVELTAAQLHLLLGGLDLKQTRRRGWLS